MALRKRGVTFLIYFRKGGFPQKRGGSNPGGNYVSLKYLKATIIWRCSSVVFVVTEQSCEPRGYKLFGKVTYSATVFEALTN